MKNYPQQMLVAESATIEENGAGVYDADFVIPARAVILDIVVHNEVLWAADTSADLDVGDFTAAGAELDANGFFAGVDLKATDLLAGESINLDKQGGLGGAYAIVGTNTHVSERVSLVDRILRARVTSVGEGDTGRTTVVVVYAQPSTVTVTQ